MNTCPSFGFKRTFAATVQQFLLKMAYVAVFRYFLAIFLVPGRARDPNNFLKTHEVFGFAHRVVKCELYTEK